MRRRYAFPDEKDATSLELYGDPLLAACERAKRALDPRDRRGSKRKGRRVQR
jgi:hypothetical protein